MSEAGKLRHVPAEFKDYPMSLLEVAVEGVPASLQSRGRGKEKWRELVVHAAREAIAPDNELYDECRGMLVFFYSDETDLDVDNIVKPVSDALLWDRLL